MRDHKGRPMTYWGGLALPEGETMKTTPAAEAIPAEILTQHTGVLGKTGSGKTSTSKLLVERVVQDGYRVCVLDPIKSDWWGISTAADGKRAGLPFVILGGPYGHVPLSSSSAAAIGELVGRGKIPLSVLDLSNLEPGGVQKFFVHFAEALWRSQRGVIYLVLEEAHEFAPKERAGFGAENLSIHWAKKLATGARAKGIRLVVATQRTQSLHNAVLGSCETMIVHRLTQPADQKPLLGWLKANVRELETRQEIEASMSSLKTGTGWLCSGEAQIFRRVSFPRITTFDNSATPTGDDDKAQAVRPADIDLGELKEALADAVAEAEANDPAMLRKRIRDLETDLARGPVGNDVKSHEEGRRKGFEQGYTAGFSTVVASVRGVVDKGNAFIAEIAGVAEHAKNFAAALDVVDAVLQCPPIAPFYPGPYFDTAKLTDADRAQLTDNATRPRSTLTIAVDAAREPAARALEANGGTMLTRSLELGKGEHAVLTAIAQHGEQGADQAQLYVLTGYKARSISDYVGRLRVAGFVTVGWPTKATPAGLRALGPTFAPLPSGAKLRQYWGERLTGGEAKIFDALVSCYPGGLSNDDIGKRTQYAARSVSDYVGRLKSRRLVDRKGAHLYASPTLFG